LKILKNGFDRARNKEFVPFAIRAVFNSLIIFYPRRAFSIQSSVQRLLAKKWIQAGYAADRVVPDDALVHFFKIGV